MQTSDAPPLATSAAERLVNRSPDAIRFCARTGKLRCVTTTTGVRLFALADVLDLGRQLRARRRGRR
jgi:DNA-binding transcriptional MerR regulator